MSIKILYTLSFLIFTLLVIPTLVYPFVIRAQSETVSNLEADSANVPLSTPPAVLADASKARVIFKSPLSVPEVAKLAESKGLYVEMLEGEFTVGGVSLYDFYPVTQQVNPETLEADYARSRLAYFADTLQEEAYLTEEQRKSLAPQFQAMKIALQRQDAGPIRIQKAAFAGDTSAIQALSKNDLVDQVNVVNNEQQPKTTSPTSNPQSYNNKIERTHKKISEENTVSVNAAITQTLPSVPRYGTSYTYPSSISGQRYTRQYMKWEWISFASNHTYEHELLFENHDRASYLNGGTTVYPGCFPVITYASTSWPASVRPYLDTRVKPANEGIGCAIDELEFTIGAFQANQLQVNTLYNNYIRTTNGNANNDRFKVQGEVGHQNPSNCPSGQETWCVYGDIGVDFLQAWNSEVPGTKSWELGVRFCEHNRSAGYGRCLDLKPGKHDLTEYNFNDVLTTIRIGQGIQWRVTVYEHVNPSTNYCYGSGWIFTSGGGRWEINLYENNLNFNDKASCAIVEFK